MGLDMYLYARRKVDAQTAEKIAARYGKKTADVASDADEGGLYLPAWSYMAPAETEKARAAFTDANLAAFIDGDSDSTHGHLAAKSGSFFVDVECAYWRKANAVHGWLVDNIQDGIDECQDSRPITTDELKALREVCATFIGSLEKGEDAFSVLPGRKGFFFGVDDDPEWASQDAVRTIRHIDRLLPLLAANQDVEIFYRASW